jgi:hypothetical protein
MAAKITPPESRLCRKAGLPRTGYARLNGAAVEHSPMREQRSKPPMTIHTSPSFLILSLRDHTVFASEFWMPRRGVLCTKRIASWWSKRTNSLSSSARMSRLSPRLAARIRRRRSHECAAAILSPWCGIGTSVPCQSWNRNVWSEFADRCGCRPGRFCPVDIPGFGRVDEEIRHRAHQKNQCRP